MFTVLARMWQSLAGVVTVVLIARYLSAAEQGYYYTFGSLVALQIVFELGFSFVVLQMASHERVHLSISSNGDIEGDPTAHARLASIFRKLVNWYSAAAILMCVIVLPVGLRFFTSHQATGPTVAWQAAWCSVVLVASLAFQLTPILSFLEGCGYVEKVALLRFAQAVTGSFLAWVALAFRHGLFAPALVILGGVGTTVIWLFGKRNLLFGLLKYDAGPNCIDWRAEVWPFQWRIAISWLCNYFTFQLFNPILFAFRGPIAAGQMGMSLLLAGAIQTIAIAWINTKSAPFGAMIARKQYRQLDHVFFGALKQSMTVCSLAGILIWLAVAYANILHLRVAERLLKPSLLGVLLLTTTLNIIVFAEALYLRAHKQEKFLINSILSAILTASSAYLLGRRYGAAGIVTGYLAVTLVIGLGLGTFVFTKYRSIWHSE